MTRFLLLLGLLLGALGLSPAPASALLAEHLNYDGCNTCHNLHGSPALFGALLSDLTPEATCLGCHGPLGIATEASIHGTSGQVTCLECHNPHNNDRLNILGGNNILLLGMAKDANTGEDLATPQIREETASGLGPLKEVVFEVTPDDWHRPSDSYGICNACHVAIHNEGVDCRGCHSHSGGFAGTGCTGCHDGAGAGALKVGPGSSHSENLTGYSCEDCHTAHSSGTIEIPNNIDVGINYSGNDESGIALGSAVATGDTEADICWNCHAIEGVSEWGLNSDSNGAAANFDFGDISGPLAPAWVDATGTTGATWTSANFGYKTAAIQSTHSVDGTATTPGLDPVDNIRCSYCHDVHDINQAPGDTATGKPYLRGSWMGNPYREDGAPQSGTVYGEYEWGPVPRGSVLNNEYGGYQIDQNNGNPTATWTLATSAGLCTLCHGSDVDNMNWFDVDETGAPELPAASWVGTNGHSNAVIGGSGSNAVNIFYTSDRAPSGVNTDGANPDMGYSNHAPGFGYGFRGTDGRSFRHLPGMDGLQASKGSQPYGGNYYEWGATVDEGTTDPQYHKFSCSKCHNPHASRLPRLMITNCLDTKHNTWDENAGDTGPSISNTNARGITLDGTSSPDNWLRTWSNTTSAQNCHRLAGDNRGAPVPGSGSGWNNVTPW